MMTSAVLMTTMTLVTLATAVAKGLRRPTMAVAARVNCVTRTMGRSIMSVGVVVGVMCVTSAAVSWFML